MQWIPFVTLFLCGCFLSAPLASAAQSKESPTASIVVTHEPTRTPPMIVTFRAETAGLAPPLRLHWSLGNGREWEGAAPPTQFYGVGRYDVILTVTDAEGLIKKASVAIDSASHGCGF